VRHPIDALCYLYLTLHSEGTWTNGGTMLEVALHQDTRATLAAQAGIAIGHGCGVSPIR